MSSFVGRQPELRVVTELLAQSRIVTLLGPGGIGKTRLVIEAPTAIKHRFTDGVVFLALASILDFDMVATALTQALGVQHMDDRSIVDRLRRARAVPQPRTGRGATFRVPARALNHAQPRAATRSHAQPRAGSSDSVCSSIDDCADRSQ